MCVIWSSYTKQASPSSHILVNSSRNISAGHSTNLYPKRRPCSCKHSHLLGIISADIAVQLATRNGQLLASLNPKALHRLSLTTRLALLPLLDGRITRRAAQDFTIAPNRIVDGDGAARPEHAAEGKGPDALGRDARVNVVAVLVADGAEVVSLVAGLVGACPDGEAPCFGADEGDRGVGEEG